MVNFVTLHVIKFTINYMEALTFDTTEKILLAATGVLFVIQILYYFCLYNRIHLHNRAVKRSNVHFSQELPPVSVIICAREESENLRRNLTAVLEQDYPQFEVIVINDGDTDESEDYLTLLEEKYPHLYHSFVPDSSRYISRKKLAVTLGIKASKYDWLVFTEADCRPATPAGTQFHLTHTSCPGIQRLRTRQRLAAQAHSVRQPFHFHALSRFRTCRKPLYGYRTKSCLPQGTVLPGERLLRTSQPSTR